MSNKLKILNKKAVISIALILVMTFGMLAAVIPLIKADTPTNRSTYIFASGEPTPIGVNQTIYLTFIMSTVPPAQYPTNAPRFGTWNGITLSMTDPNGQVTNMTNLSTSYAGAGTVSYVPTIVGTYTFYAQFFGQTITTGTSTGTYYGPSVSTTANFTVQSAPVGYLSYPAPSSYWTFPIEAENQAWHVYAGNWLAGDRPNASQPAVYNPWVTGPLSSHIMWSQPWVTGGLAGGSYQSGLYQFGRWPGGSDQYFCPFISNGIMYVNLPVYYIASGATVQYTGFEAINLATDQVIWKQTAYNDTLTYMTVLSYDTSTMATGTYSMLWSTTGSNWRTYDPLTGNLLQTITPTTGGTVTFGTNGELMIYYISNTGHWLAAWNSTQFEEAIDPSWTYSPVYAPNSVYIVQLGTYSAANWTLGYQWNVSLPTSLSGNSWSIAKALPNDEILLQQQYSITNTTSASLDQTAVSITPNIYTSLGTNASGAMQVPGQTVSVLFQPVNRTIWVDSSTYTRIESAGYTSSGAAVYVMYPRETLSIQGFSATTGALLWTTTPMDTWAYFDSESNNIQVADGKVFACGYDGTLWAFDLATGNLLWTYYVGDAGLNTAYGTWPIDGSYSYYTIAGGVVYMGANEHSPNNPTWLGGQVWAVNDTSGQLIWKIDSVQDETQPIAVADNQAIWLNFYDGQLYDVGQGPSSTTVSAPQTQITEGQTITITGTVMDVSIGSKQAEQAGDFPNGLPCVSDASESAWMEYAYMQKPMPTNATGVTVTLTAVDPNHNTIPMGTTTTDTTGKYGFSWCTPNVPGTYQIIATFSGTNSYWGSNSATYATITAPTAASPSPTVTPTSVADMYFVPAIAGIFVLIIIVLAVVIVLALRKRP